MPFSHFEPPHLTKRVIVKKTSRYWKRTCAWILAPVLIGLVGVGMAQASDYAFEINTWIVNRIPWASILYMPAGFALIAYIARRFFPGTQGSGIPQTIAVIDDPDHKKKSNLLSVKILVGKIAMLLGGLTIGASIGREGPTVQVGASIMHAFYGYGTLRTAAQRRMLALSGGAAGIAAAFNTPLAGIMFAMEELTKKYIFNAHSSTLLTVILSGLISMALVGNYTYFGYTNESLSLLTNIPAILVCGIAGGLTGGLFSLIVQKISVTPPPKIRKAIQEHPLIFAAICGLVVAILGLLTDGLVYGTSYQPTRMTLESDSTCLVWYYGALFPNLAPHGAIIILVMSAYLSGVTRSPLTSFIITMEMTGSHQMLLALMAVSLLATLVSRYVTPVPLYHALSQKFIAPQESPTTVHSKS